VARIAVVTSSPPGVEGGHIVIARALADALDAAGHEATIVTTPECQFGRQAQAYFETWRTDVHMVGGRPIEQVISLRFPSYAVRHDAHVCWLNHTMREYYDLWPRFSAAISPRARAKERFKRAIIQRVDRWLLTRNVTDVVAQSRTIQRRLRGAFGLAADVQWPPAPPRPYRCARYGDYIFAVSRMTPLKRIDLLVRALAEPAARAIRAVIAGDGEERSHLTELAESLNVSNRIAFVGRLDDSEMVQRLADCRAVCFTPFDEDYGLVTIEAFQSAKAVVTCEDSGGPTELVEHERTGLVAAPTAAAVAAALARLMDDRALAERLGANARARADAVTWAQTVKRLVIV